MLTVPAWVAIVVLLLALVGLAQVAVAAVLGVYRLLVAREQRRRTVDNLRAWADARDARAASAVR